MTAAIHASDDDSYVSLRINGADKLKIYQDGTIYAANMQGWRNRIINGDMRIDQRNAGSPVTLGAGSSGHSTDRWLMQSSQTTKFTAQQNLDSITPPAGFTHYIGFNSLSSYNVAAGDYFIFQQRIEGANLYDIGWGTANAQPITITFRVRSTITGTFSCTVANYSGTLAYPSTYTINAANTWETKTITVAGKTSGNWGTYTNDCAMIVYFSLGCGANFSTPAGSWGSGNFFAASGETSFVGTSGAKMYFTGIQLEKGSYATPYEYLDYSEQLRRCQRYYEKSYDINVVPGTASSNAGKLMMRGSGSASRDYLTVQYKVQKRAGSSATVTWFSSRTGAAGNVNDAHTTTDYTASTNGLGDWSASMQSSSTFPANDQMEFHYTCANEL